MRRIALFLGLAAGLAFAVHIAFAQDSDGGKKDDDGGKSTIDFTGGGDSGTDSGNKPGDNGSKPNKPADKPQAPKVKISLQKRINIAIENGVKWLKKAQHKDGSWGPCVGNKHYGQNDHGTFPCYFSGPTSFSIYTLSKCGVSQHDPVVRKGYKWLHERYRDFFTKLGQAGQQGMVTYECSSLILMMEAMHERTSKLAGRMNKRRLYTKNPYSMPHGSHFTKDDWKWMHELIVFLTEGIHGRRIVNGCQNKNGGWRYGQANGDQDVSATQFVLLGLRAASMAGYPVKPVRWIWALEFLKKVQSPDGGFGYKMGSPVNAGMTAAGIASTIICKEQLQLADDKDHPVPAYVDDMIKRGLAKLDKLFDATQNVGPHDNSGYHYYYLYSVERVGVLTGLHDFNGKDWYLRGAEFLLDHQSPEGAWSDPTTMAPHDVLGTCFALLFLKRATVPAVTISER